MQTYAGFWRRLVAFIIDNIIVSILTWLLSMYLLRDQISPFLSAQTQEEYAVAMSGFFLFILGFNILFLIVFILYPASMESSSIQGTLGKMVMGIKVVDKNGRRLRFWHAVARNLGKLLSALIAYFGFFMAAFTQHRQALHDIMASTFVVNNSYQPGGPLPQEPFRRGCLVSSLVFIALSLLCALSVISFIIWMIQDTENNKNISPQVRMLQAQMRAVSNMDIPQETPLNINEMSFYTQNGSVYATHLSPNAFTVKLPRGSLDLCCVRESAGFCHINNIEPCW